MKNFLSDLGVIIRDFGTDSETAVDYPDFAHAVARSVSTGQVDIGIIVDGAGIGSAMTANKVPPHYANPPGYFPTEANVKFLRGAVPPVVAERRSMT